MRFFATLISGKTYGVNNIVFKLGEEKEVDAELYHYLKRKSCFKTRAEGIATFNPYETDPQELATQDLPEGIVAEIQKQEPPGKDEDFNIEELVKPQETKKEPKVKPKVEEHQGGPMEVADLVKSGMTVRTKKSGRKK